MFSSIPDSSPEDVSNTLLSSPPPVVMTKNVSKQCQMSPLQEWWVEVGRKHYGEPLLVNL